MTIIPRGLRLIALIPALLLVSACVSKQVKRVNEVQAQQAQTELPTEQVLSIVVTQFDPGIPETIKEQQEERIYPEVRKAEANFIPQVLRSTLDNTGYWGTVRVLPKATASTMIEVGGKILHSDGETLRVRVYAKDATGRKWLDKEYEEVAAELSYTEKTISALDPFQDLYNNIANDLLAQRNKLTAEQMLELKRVSKLKFAADLAPARFEGYLQSDSSGRLSVKRLPPESDPIVQRIEDVRLRDDLLVDTLDAHYSAFQQNMRPAYQEWRRANYSEVIALRELEQQALGRKIAGAAAVVGGVYALATAENAGTAAAGSVGVIGGVGLITSGLHKGKEAELHAESLRELNSSISDDVAPRVVKLDEKTITLSGSADEQYAQWRKLLQQRYALETGATP